MRQIFFFQIVLVTVLLFSGGCRDSNSGQAKSRSGKTTVVDRSSAAAAETSNFGAAPRFTHKDHFAYVRIDIRRLLANPKMAEIEWDELFKPIFSAAGNLFSSVNDIDALTFIADQQLFGLLASIDEESTQSLPLVVVVTGQRVAAADAFGQDFSQVGSDAEQVFVDSAGATKVWLFDDENVVFGPTTLIDKLLGEHAGNGGLLLSTRSNQEAAISGNVLISPIRPTLKSFLGPMRAMVPEVNNIIKAVDALDRFDFAMDLTAAELGSGNFSFSDSTRAAEFRTQLIDYAKSMSSVNQGFSMPSDMDDMAVQSSKQLQIWPKVMSEITQDGLSVTANQRNVAIVVRRPRSLDDLLTAMVDDAKSLAILSERSERLQRVGHALLSYYEVNREFPLPTWSVAPDEGKFSWRVAVLPLLGHEEIYSQFNLNESWDSPHNMRVAENIPPEYLTRIEVIGGPDGPFVEGRALTLENVTDEHEATVMIAEAPPADDYLWHRPSSIPFAKNDGLPQLGMQNESGVLVVTFSGELKTLSRKSVPSFRAALTHNAGDRVGRQGFQR
ncbi:MAG TPA: DUF1559 domain-containing protein [Pirellulaceae bacterium]|nr:DUF1559 domain-containing protein [Pirellulaceae bacterium]HMO93527.1 DUF1559 domain-containing protein [Pirellulaceae bacterium]HMP70361.1 DUF1559 domain-containing protein [Pirellulaceae bacterium]